MQGGMGLVMVLGFIGFVVGLVLLARYMEKKRTEAVNAWAQANGYTVDTDVIGFQHAMERFKLFNQGRSRVLKNVVRTARDDYSLTLADYRYTTGSGKHQTTHHQTVCVVQSPRSPLPHFFLRRQVALFDALGKLFGGQDINFDDDPAFSKAFVLQSIEGEDECRRLFQPEARDAFTALAKKNVQCEGLGDTLLFHLGRQLKPEQFDELVGDALAVRHALR